MKTGILNNNGTITTWVDTKEKTKKGSHGELAKADAQALGATLMVYGDDGKIWMLRPGAKPVIFAVSPAGEIIHQYKLTAPTDASYDEIYLAEGKGKFVVVFSPKQQTIDKAPDIYRMHDNLTGEVLAEYSADETSSALIGCYANSEFVTLKLNTKTKFFDLVKARP